MKIKTGLDEFYAPARDTWRAWLQKHHAIKSNVWLILFKKGSNVPSVSVSEAVEEALCFGWIDSKPSKRDDQSYRIFFSVRKPKSVWSKINKQRIALLIKEGKMTEAGLQKIEVAKKNGSWTTLDDIEEYKMPPALEAAFKKNKTAKSNFAAFPPSAQKAIYQWIISAKTEATLTRRVTETVEKAQQNIRANQWTPKQK